MFTDLPPQFTLYSLDAMDTTNRWWKNFQSVELNALIDEALTNSPSIQQSWARLAQAEAVAKKSGASRWPSLSADGDARVSRNSLEFTNVQRYSLGLNASYELDLWGRVKSVAEAAALDHEATREQFQSAAMTLTSQTALRWSGIISQHLQTELLRRQLEANQTSLELVELRFRKSKATALDVYQQRQTVANTESRIPLAELREQLLLNELAALLGRSDFHSTSGREAARMRGNDQREWHPLEISTEKLPTIGNLPAIGIPADVLANRPDVRQAGLKLFAADWSVRAARADRLPAIRLSASGEYANGASHNLFNDWYGNLLGSVTGPIFEGGRRKAEVERTRAVVDERLGAYRETVLNAMKEVENALVSEQKQHEYIEALDRNLELSRSSYEEAVNRYRNGLSEYLPVLVELVGLQTLERDRVAAQYDLLQYRIDLYRALGGTWASEFNPGESQPSDRQTSDAQDLRL